MMRENELKEIGVHQYAVLSPREIIFEEEIRKICGDNVCGSYGKNWACPPAVGTVEQCKERCLQYTEALVFSSVHSLEDEFDYEGMLEGRDAFKELCDKLYFQMKKRSSSFLILSNGVCHRCEKCTYPTGECRRPDMLFPAMEGFGINVMKLAKYVGMNYNNGKNTVTYFGMLLY